MGNFVLNSEGVVQLLQSPEMKKICEKHAKNALSRLGDGYDMSTHVWKDRVHAQVEAVTYEAQRDNAENNTILKAIRG